MLPRLFCLQGRHTCALVQNDEQAQFAKLMCSIITSLGIVEADLEQGAVAIGSKARQNLNKLFHCKNLNTVW